MAKQLPSKLNKEPLIDALFELRFNSITNFTELAPGFLFTKLPGELELQRLHTSELPKTIRDQDPNLRYSNLVRIIWGHYVIGLGDRSITVGCKLPYPGWKNFSAAIMTVMNALSEAKLIKSVLRYSLKYTDLIPAESISEQLSKITISIRLPDIQELHGHTTLRTELFDNGYIHILNILTSAQANMASGEKGTGIVIDVDSIKLEDEIDFDLWLKESDKSLDSIHSVNKEMFFKCITEETIDSLEPTYE